MTNITGARTTENITQARRVVDMADQICLLDPDIGPFLTILKKLKKDTRKCFSPKVEWLEDQLLANASTITTAISAASETAVAVADGSIFREGDVINVPAVGENMLVTKVSGNTLTVTRGYGTQTAAAAIAAQSQILNLGSAMPENSKDRGAKSTQEAAKFNYTQIFRTPAALSNTEQASKLYGGKDRAYQRRKTMQEHKRDIALALYFGQRKEDTTGGQVRRTMGGLTSYLADGNVIAFDKANAPLTYQDFDERVAYNAFLHGSQNKLLIAGPKLYRAINGWAVNNLVTEVGADQTYGLNVRKLITSYGEMAVVYDKLLAGDTYSGYGMVLDMDYARYCYLDGRDTKLNVDIQNNDVDGVIDEYLTECSLELKCPDAHVLITGAY